MEFIGSPDSQTGILQMFNWLASIKPFCEIMIA
jgi:hypothetical protein